MEVVSPPLSVSSEKVLVVDDNQKLLGVVKDLLAKHGYEVVTASGAQDALSYLEEEIPSLILCDIMMPDISGIDFHRQLKHISHLTAVPFVFLSAISDKKDINAVRESGCAAYLTKPFDPEDLLAIVQGKIKLYKERQNAERERADAERKKIVHALSHEFRTPLVSINSGAELLLCQQEGLEEKQVNMLLRSIIRGGQRLQNLVDDFVLLQQIDCGQANKLYQNYKRAKSVGSIINTALIEFRKKNADKGACPIEVVYEDEDLRDTEVTVYDVQVVSAVERILSNGRKFAGKEKTLTLKVDLIGNSIRFRIRDQGPGLPEQLHREVFELFQQVNRTYNEQQGAGLGLSIASYFTKINGGELLFTTPDDGVGLEVEMTLPLETK